MCVWGFFSFSKVAKRFTGHHYRVDMCIRNGLSADIAKMSCELKAFIFMQMQAVQRNTMFINMIVWRCTTHLHSAYLIRVTGG